jgi:hypothetical protein
MAVAQFTLDNRPRWPGDRLKPCPQVIENGNKPAGTCFARHRADVDESPGEIHVSRALISETRNPAKRPMALKARRSLSFDSASSDAPVRVSGCLAAWR